MSDVLSLLPVDDPSLTDEVTWVPASPLPEEPVQVFCSCSYIRHMGLVPYLSRPIIHVRREGSNLCSSRYKVLSCHHLEPPIPKLARTPGVGVCV